MLKCDNLSDTFPHKKTDHPLTSLSSECGIGFKDSTGTRVISMCIMLDLFFQNYVKLPNFRRTKALEYCKQMNAL